MNILYVTSSSRGSASYSNRVATNVLDRTAQPQSRRDGSRCAISGASRLPHINDDFVTATRGADDAADG